MSREWSYSGRIDRKCQHFWECPPPLRPKRAAQTAAQDFAPADTPKKQQIKRKRDTSNEVRKGTFLKRLDKLHIRFLTSTSAYTSIAALGIGFSSPLCVGPSGHGLAELSTLPPDS